jgi:hypothetical protein
MKKGRCKTCKKPLARGGPGRPAAYCSPACRQRAYRKRSQNPRAVPLRLLRNDLLAVADREARKRAAVDTLNQLGYEVQLTRVGANPRQIGRAKPQLKVIDRDAPDGE